MYTNEKDGKQTWSQHRQTQSNSNNNKKKTNANVDIKEKGAQRKERERKENPWLGCMWERELVTREENCGLAVNKVL